jgi:hypothetical protein
MAAAVVGLVAVVLATGLGGVGRLVGQAGAAVGSLIDRVGATPVPSVTPPPTLDTAVLLAPANQYTNQATVTLRGSIPADVVGDVDYRVRIDVTVAGQPTVVVKEIAMPATAAFTVPGIPLAVGQNDFTATIVGTGHESDPSAVVTYVLDIEPPAVVVSSPADGSTINGDKVDITGRTQPLSAVSARNEVSGATATATAGDDGTFALTVPIAAGPNGISISVVDPAGNPGSAVLGVLRGDGKLTADISASDYRLSDAALPQALTVRVAVVDPDGHPLPGASVLFTITVPGIPPIVPSPVMTDATGVASFQTTVPAAATQGTGPVTALVTTEQFGRTSVQTVLTIGP